MNSILAALLSSKVSTLRIAPHLYSYHTISCHLAILNVVAETVGILIKFLFFVCISGSAGKDNH